MVVFKGNLAPEGAVMKVGGVHKSTHSGPARVFDSEEACFAARISYMYSIGEWP